MSKEPAHVRVRRLLSVIPWIVANPGHKVEEIASRFNYDAELLMEDLGVVYMIGLPPYTPDALVDVEIDEDSHVTIRLADYFSRPLQLTPGQALSLLAASEARREEVGADAHLDAALTKLADQLGIDSEAVLDVSLGEVDDAVLADVRTALDEHRDVEIEYFSFARNEVSKRTVTPWKLFADSGYWYLQAWCQSAEGERLFRADRIAGTTLLTEATNPAPESKREMSTFSPSDSAPRVTLKISEGAMWVLEAYPYEKIKRVRGGVEVTMVVMAGAWLQRLLLKLGPLASVVSAEGIEVSEPLLKAISEIESRYLTTTAPSK